MAVTVWDIKKATLCDDLEGIEELTYADRAVEQLGAITGLFNLQQLSMAFNSLSSLRGMGALQHLRSLNVAHNNLPSLSGLAELTGLTALNAGHNSISSLAALPDLRGLVELRLHHNAVADPAEVLHLKELADLRGLTLCGNPVCTAFAAAAAVTWRAATIGLLPDLQVLDAEEVTDEERSAASATAHQWAAAAVDGSSCKTAASEPACSSEHSRAEVRQRIQPPSATSSRKAGMLVHQPSDASTFQDIADLLPDINVPSLKPRMLPSASSKGREGTPNLLPAAKRKPPTVIYTQNYLNGSTAVTIRSNGTATINWPGGELAASLDIDDATDPAYPGYRLLAMFRGAGVAVSYDLSGGFVQQPNGALVLLYNRKEGAGTAYSSKGGVTTRWNTKRPGMKLPSDVEAVLDAHFAVRLVAKRNELQLFFACQGIMQQLSLLYGAIIPGSDAGDNEVPPRLMTSWPPESSSEPSSSDARRAAQECSNPAKQGQAARQPPAATLPQANLPQHAAQSQDDAEQQDLQDLLARARALMATSAAITASPPDAEVLTQ